MQIMDQNLTDSFNKLSVNKNVRYICQSRIPFGYPNVNTSELHDPFCFGSQYSCYNCSDLPNMFKPIRQPQHPIVKPIVMEDSKKACPSCENLNRYNYWSYEGCDANNEQCMNKLEQNFQKFGFSQ